MVSIEENKVGLDVLQYTCCRAKKQLGRIIIVQLNQEKGVYQVCDTDKFVQGVCWSIGGNFTVKLVANKCNCGV